MAYSIGQIITMNLDGTDRDYRILKLNGNIAEVVAMFTTASTTTFGTGRTYADSALDIYLNDTWYGTLSDTAKSAIVDKTFRQDSWYSGDVGNPDYSGFRGETNPGTTAYTISRGSTTYGSQITRHVYALSVQDVIDFLYATDTSGTPLQNYNIWNMFWNDTVSHSRSFWLRSAFAGANPHAWDISNNYGSIDNTGVTSTIRARPAFQIDLSKIFPTDITLDLSTIGLSAGTHSIQMKLSDDGLTKRDSELSNAVQYISLLPQLDAPTNLTADGTTIEFDEVENAEKYEIFADGESIGEYTPPAYDYEEEGSAVVIRNAPYREEGNEVIIL